MIQDYFEAHLKDGYQFHITDATLSRDQKTLYITMQTNFLLPYDTLEEIKGHIKEEIAGVGEVAFLLRFGDMVMDREEIIQNSLTYLKARLAKDPWIRTMETEGFDLTEDKLTIYVLGQRASENLNETAAKEVAKLLNHDFGYELTVEFANNEDATSQTLEDVEQMDDEPDPVPVFEPDQTAAAAEGEQDPFPDGVVKGRKINGLPTPMNQLPGDGASVVVAGTIFSVETRLVNKSEKAKKFAKNGSDKTQMVKVLFSDNTDSQCLKMWCDPEDWDRIGGAVKEGKDILVSGKVEYDPYDRANVIMGRDINLWAMPKRQDTYPEKRIELHAHTKMSALDGATDVEALVKRAIDWGHEAIAITDHGVVHALPKAYSAARGKIKVIMGMEGYLYDDEGKIDSEGNIDIYSGFTNHIVLLAQTQEGLKNLYKLVSFSHMDYFYKRPRLPRSVLNQYREGILLGSACQAGELYQALLAGEPEEKLEQIADFYDYLEVQPICNNEFMVNDDRYPVESIEDIKNLNRRVVELGKRLGKPVVITSDIHYLDPEDNVIREIIRAGQGYGDIGKDSGLYFKTTDEMMEELSYLDEQDRYDLVIGNPAKINAMIENLAPTPGNDYPRPQIENADNILRDSCYTFAKERYGDPLPEAIQERLDKELSSIIDNGYAVLYVSAKMLVDKAREDGYVVGSRGSVGSSVAAFFSGISEVNPLKPHYVCPSCKHVIWGDESQFECGVDMPPMNCPECGSPMDQDGYSIPFETFLGFKGDKEPDIDLNFAGEYQATAQQFVDNIFGAENTLKAGTVGTVKDKTAYGFIKAYNEATHTVFSRYERERLAMRCLDIKRTTGQHPGGIVIVPEGHEIYEVTPIQYPANKKDLGIVTTHFDYHAYEGALLKLDILGHDGPSMVRLLKKSSGIDPEQVPYSDPKVLSLFTGTDELAIQDPEYKFTDGTYGVPEFGTPIARGMLNDTKPTTIGELVRLSGLAHGTDVWAGNAQDLIRKGVASIDQVIATRDDIMTYLIAKGLPAPEAFDIMEAVRKGKVAKKEVKNWDQSAKDMREHNVPQWYIDSCEKIQYMFPRGHAAAYVIMSCRIAYFKVYHPEHFYAARFTSKVDDFNWDVVRQGSQAVWNRMEEINRQIEEAPSGETTTKIKDEHDLLEIVYEMYARGYEFEPPNLERSEGDHFTVHEGRVVVPFNALNGVGTNAGMAIKNAYNERPFQTVEDLQVRGKANKSVVETLRAFGVLEGMAESDQISMF